MPIFSTRKTSCQILVKTASVGVRGAINVSDSLTVDGIGNCLRSEMLNVVTKLYIFKYSSIIKGKNVNIS